MDASRDSQQPHGREGCEGFSLVEVLIVVAIVGIIVNIAIPVMINAQAKANAARVLADVDLIHDAVLNYRLEHGSYPDTAAFGVVPGGLAPYLPDGFEFSYKDLRYRFQLQRRDKRIVVDGGGRNSSGREVVGHIAEMYQGRSRVNARRVWLWLPSPGGRID